MYQMASMHCLASERPLISRTQQKTKTKLKACSLNITVNIAEDQINHLFYLMYNFN